MNKELKTSWFDIITTFVIIVGPMFTQYSSISNVILLPELFIFPLLLYYFFVYRNVTLLNLKWYFLYFIICLILTLINILVGTPLDITISIFAFLRHIFYALIIVSIGYKNFNVDYAAKLLIIVAFFNSIYGFIQYIVYNLTGTILPWYFSFLPVKYGVNLIENSNYYFSEFGYRFSGLFSEPAHFSQYIAIALMVTIFYKPESFIMSKSIRIFISIIFILALLLNGSGTGFAMILFILVLVILNRNDESLKIKLLKIIFLFLVITFLLYIGSHQILTTGLSRILSSSELSSGNIRVLRPFYIFNSLPILSKFIGVGYANYSEYVISSSLVTDYEMSLNSAWTNTIGYILVGSGIIGFSFYIFFIFYLLRNTKYLYKYLVVMIILFSFFTELPLSFQFITIMGFINKRKI